MKPRSRAVGSTLRRVLALVLIAALASGCVPATSTPLENEALLEREALPESEALLMPVEGVRVRDVVSNFGASRGTRVHEGIDIFAPRDTPVRSAGHGVVHFLGNTPRGGWTVWIRDGNRDVWYAHLAAIAPDLAPGMPVTPQTTIGWVGNSGNASGGPPHLHFELVTPAGPVDPLPFLVDRF